MNYTPLSERREVAVIPQVYRTCRALCIDGASTRTVGRRVGLTEEAVKYHIKCALRATGCGDRMELVVAIWSGRVDIVTKPKDGEERRLLRELWTMLGHPSSVDAQQSA